MTCRNYMYYEPNRHYRLAPFCCSNISHDLTTPDIAPSFNVCSMWASFIVFCLWVIDFFEKVVDSVVCSEKLAFENIIKGIYSNFCDKHSFVMIICEISRVLW